MRYTQKSIKQLEKRVIEKEREVKELEKKTDIVTSPENVLRVMNKVGYAPKGSSSYIFAYNDTTREEKVDSMPLIKEPLVLNSSTMILFSILISSTIHLFLFLAHRYVSNMKRKKKRSNFSHNYDIE